MLHKSVMRKAVEIVRNAKLNAEENFKRGVCIHGVFLGRSGPDYLCGDCESGISIYEYALREAIYYRDALKYERYNRWWKNFRTLSPKEQDRRMRKLLFLSSGGDVN